MSMNMFNKKETKKRIGDISKSKTLDHLKDVEKYYYNKVKSLGIDCSYDVVAMELPYFKTLQYTEWAHSFSMNPLSQELRYQQLYDAWLDDKDISCDWMGYWKDRIESGQSNKYQDIKNTVLPPRDHVVVLVGSNKLKETICLNKLLYIRKKFGEANVYYKPHPLTTHQLIGELRDELGEDLVVNRDVDMYNMMLGCKVVHTSHMSESAIYAVALGKEVDPIDVYNKIYGASYYHINRWIFEAGDPHTWMQRALQSPKCGIVNPDLQDDWKQRIDEYLDYILSERDRHRYQFVESVNG